MFFLQISGTGSIIQLYHRFIYYINFVLMLLMLLSAGTGHASPLMISSHSRIIDDYNKAFFCTIATLYTVEDRDVAVKLAPHARNAAFQALEFIVKAEYKCDTSQQCWGKA